MFILLTIFGYFTICFANVDTKLPIDEVSNNATSNIVETVDLEPIFDLLGEANSATHLTVKYKIQNYSEEIVLRRGLDFKFQIRWGRPCDSNDEISLFFKLMTFKYNNEVTVNIDAKKDITEEGDSEEWSAKYGCIDDDIGQLLIHIPITASIGSYGLILTSKHHGKIKKYVVHKNIAIIFNPYLSKDTVFMEDELGEYVENESGYIWIGSTNKQYKRPWLYGQFESIVLNTTFYALNVCNLTAEERASPVEVARAISAISNQQDDWGVLIGRWDGDYVDIYGQNATPPTRWLGSVAILELYRRTKISVPYGQCWVFAGVMTTMLRALGIPSRPVTCYSCGHDTDNNLMIDFYLDEDGKKMNKTTDSIWNYHVWVQVFMRRYDLSTNGIFDGWQDVDGTPQEKSGTKFQMGPTPVNAVKLGIVDAQYDLPFVYSEVNADVVWWKVDSIQYIETTKIGSYVLTKSVGAAVALDITATYKAQEKSKEERDTLKKICDRLNITHPSFNATIKQRSKEMRQQYFVEIKSEDTINLGDLIVITVRLKSMTWNQFKRKELNIKKLHYTLTVETMHYDGHRSKEVKTEKELITINNANGVKIKTILKPEEYEGSEDYDYFLITFTATDLKSGAFVLKEKEVHIKSPTLKVTFGGRTAHGNKVILIATYTNPLTVDAENCALIVETQWRERQEIVFKTLAPKQTITEKVKVKAPNDYQDLVLVSFSCDEVISTEVEVRLNDVQFQLKKQ